MIKFNVGCGPRNWPDWYNVDANGMDHIHSADVTLRYQPNNYIDLLYSSHLISYFSRQDFEQVLSLWFRKIKPGGILRIATPDFNKLSTLYHTGVEFEKIKGPLFGQMRMGNDTIHHKICYDEKALTNILVEAGFENIQRYDHSKTEHPNTGNRDDFYDDHSAAYINKCLISLNVQAIKPL